jgi:hypothetical protein
MFPRTFFGLIVALVASSVLSPAAAQHAAVEVILMSVTPGTPSGDGDWCVGAAQVTLTAHVVDASQSEVTEGRLVWQFCASSTLGAFPKEDCDAPGMPRWKGDMYSDLSDESPASTPPFTPNVPIMGVRLQYVPAPGGSFKRATSASFNLDTTCSS